MRIKYVEGDVLDSDFNILIHGCNCFNTMGSGIAGSIAKRWPGAFLVDQQTKRGDYNKLGTFTSYKINDKQYIINLYSQYRFVRGGVYVNYNAIESGLKLLNSSIDGNPRICMPKIGCGLAGGDWNIVRDIIERVFSDREVLVYIL